MSPNWLALTWLFSCLIATATANSEQPLSVREYIRKVFRETAEELYEDLADTDKKQGLKITEVDRSLPNLKATPSASKARVTRDLAKVEPFGIGLNKTFYYDGTNFYLYVSTDGLLTLESPIAQTIYICDTPSLCVPKGAQFFVHDNNLYLVVLSDGPQAAPVTFYMWNNIDFGKVEYLNAKMVGIHWLTAPTAITTFSTNAGTVIVVSRTKKLYWGGLSVYLMRQKQLELVQLLDSKEVVNLLPFVYRGGEYLMAVTAVAPSHLYAWDGKQLTSKTFVPNVHNVTAASVQYVNSTPFFVIPEKDHVRLFSLQGLTLGSENIVTFPGLVQSVRLEDSEEGAKILVSYEEDGRILQSIVRLNFSGWAEKEKLTEPSDVLAESLRSLSSRLEERSIVLERLKSMSLKLIQRSRPGKITGKIVVKSPHKVVLRRGNLASIAINPQDYNLTATPSQLKDEIISKLATAETLHASLAGLARKGDPLVYSSLSTPLKLKSLTVRNAIFNTVMVNTLNKRIFAPENLLMYSKNQTFRGKISSKEVKIEKVNVNTLSGMKVEDLLLDSGVQQSVAITEVPKVTAGSVHVASGQINAIPLTHVVKNNLPEGTVIRGQKTAQSLTVNNLYVELYNTVDLTTWWNSIRPDLGKEAQQQVHITSDLIVKNLTVSNVNGVNLKKLFSSLLIIGRNQEISGTVAFTNKPTIGNLSTQMILGKPSSNLLTLSSNQVFNGTVSVGGLSTSQINTNYVNKLNLATDVARLDSPAVFGGYVAFQNLVVKDLQLPQNTFINGQLLSPYFLQEQRQVYNQPVRIRGTLHVIDLVVPQGNKIMIQGQTISLNDLPSMFWTKKTSQLIPVPVSAKYPLRAKSLSVGTVNGFAPQSILHCDTLQKLSVPWWIPSAVIIGDVQHLPGSRPSALNPLALSESVVLIEGNYTIRGRKIFAGGIEVGHLWANLVDNVKPNDVVLKRDSVISGSNSWNKIEITKDLIIEADLFPTKVNNVDLCAKMSKAVRTDEAATIKSIQMNTVIADDMSLRVLNGVPLRNRNRRSVTPHLKRLVVKGTITVPELQYVDAVNTFKLAEFLPSVVNKKLETVIDGKKTWTTQVVVQQSVFTPMVNEVDLGSFLFHMLSRTRPQNVTAVYSMDSAKAKWLEAWDVNGVQVGKLLTVDGIQHIQGNLRFSRGLIVGDLTTGSLIGGCDIKKIIESLAVLKGGRWKALTIDGDLSWNMSRNPTSLAERGLGYLIDSAVTKNGNVSIVGEVVFGAPVSVDDIVSKRDINDVALEFIKNDSLLKNSPVDQVIKSPIRLTNNAQASSLVVSGNVDVSAINNINISALNQSIVRKSQNIGPVGGGKAFLKGFKASQVICDAYVNDFVTSSIVTYDMPNLPHLVLNAKMTIQGNLTFASFNNLNIQQLLEERVTLNTPQIISGSITFDNDLVIREQALFSNINNVDVSNVVTTDSPIVQTIIGPKVFTQNLTVEGLMELRYLNDLGFQASVFEAILRDLPSTIVGGVTFNAPITFEGDLTVAGTVNGITLDNLQRLLKRKALRYPKRARDQLLKELSVGRRLLDGRRNPEEVLYLDAVKNLDIRVSNMSKVVARPRMGHIRLDVYGSETDRQCGLPEDCACPVHMALELREEDGKLAAGAWEKPYERTFSFTASNTEIKVITNTTSRDSRCRASPEEIQREHTTITWSGLGPDGAYPYSTLDPGLYGYVSDVALLQYNELVYVIVGLAYDAFSDTTNMNSKMFRLDYATNSISLAQEIPTFGLSALNVFTASSVPHLVVGNSYDTAKRSAQVPLFIYRFSKTTYQLEVVRRVPTVGVVAVASLVEGSNVVIVVAQAQTNAPVLVFQYDYMYDAFKVTQQLTNTALPTGLGSFRVSDGFVGLSTADDIFRLYKYCDVEGLKLVQEYRKIGVRGFARFDLVKRYIFLTSSEESSLVELVVQGT